MAWCLATLDQIHDSTFTGAVKLDRLLAKHDSLGRTRARRAIIDGRVRVNGIIETHHHREIDRFHHVMIDQSVIAAGQQSLHIMLHKPLGVVSATRDANQPTVIDLIDHPNRQSLHIVGRLDKNTSGLLLLTNDGRWSKALMNPLQKVPKIYQVTTRDPIPPDAIAAFASGFYFHTENLTTMPAKLELQSTHTAQLTLHEGRYHQVKRMFHRIGNRVTALHRLSIGSITLPDDLAAGAWRHLTPQEIATATNAIHLE